MKYEVLSQGPVIGAIGAHSGYRIRMSLHRAESGSQVEVRIRGSESEEEVAVDLPVMTFSTESEAFDYGYRCAVLWIDAANKHIL